MWYNGGMSKKKKKSKKSGPITAPPLPRELQPYGINPHLANHANNHVYPRYNKLGHDRTAHVKQVISDSLQFASLINDGQVSSELVIGVPNLKVNYDMMYTAALYHELGRESGDEDFEKVSAVMLIGDGRVRKHFTATQLNTMQDAVQDHRPENRDLPRNIYGSILRLMHQPKTATA